MFVSRCQNLKGEHNDQPWAGKINDGSFIYSPAAGGQTKSDVLPNGGLVGYGSMTYAGIKSMIYCGVGKGDERYQKALEWIGKNYTVDANPGMPKELRNQEIDRRHTTVARANDGTATATRTFASSSSTKAASAAAAPRSPMRPSRSAISL